LSPSSSEITASIVRLLIVVSSVGVWTITGGSPGQSGRFGLRSTIR
jgi:hypothetical protein